MKERDSPDKDIKNIHLLESTYYYFSPINEEQTITEINAIIKTNIYYVSKLFTDNKISEGQMKQVLSNIRKSGNFNRQYLNTEDGLLNQIATYNSSVMDLEKQKRSMNLCLCKKNKKMLLIRVELLLLQY